MSRQCIMLPPYYYFLHYFSIYLPFDSTFLFGSCGVISSYKGSISIDKFFKSKCISMPNPVLSLLAISEKQEMTITKTFEK